MDPRWTVVLDDGTQVHQGEGVLWQDVPKDRVRRLLVTVEARTTEVIIEPPQRPVYFQQHEIRLNPDGMSTRQSVVCVGWETPDGKDLSWLLEDGTVVQTDGDWDGWSWASGSRVP